jgi:hypothetical protein
VVPFACGALAEILAGDSVVIPIKLFVTGTQCLLRFLTGAKLFADFCSGSVLERQKQERQKQQLITHCLGLFSQDSF